MKTKIAFSFIRQWQLQLTPVFPFGLFFPMVSVQGTPNPVWGSVAETVHIFRVRVGLLKLYFSNFWVSFLLACSG